MNSRQNDLAYLKRLLTDEHCLRVHVPFGNPFNLPLSAKMRQRLISVLAQQIFEEKLRAEGINQAIETLEKMS